MIILIKNEYSKIQMQIQLIIIDGHVLNKSQFLDVMGRSLDWIWMEKLLIV
jgi:type IV secretory pathway protease TraF